MSQHSTFPPSSTDPRYHQSYHDPHYNYAHMHRDPMLMFGGRHSTMASSIENGYAHGDDYHYAPPSAVLPSYSIAPPPPSPFVVLVHLAPWDVPQAGVAATANEKVHPPMIPLKMLIRPPRPYPSSGPPHFVPVSTLPSLSPVPPPTVAAWACQVVMDNPEWLEALVLPPLRQFNHTSPLSASLLSPERQTRRSPPLNRPVVVATDAASTTTSTTAEGGALPVGVHLLFGADAEMYVAVNDAPFPATVTGPAPATTTTTAPGVDPDAAEPSKEQPIVIRLAVQVGILVLDAADDGHDIHNRDGEEKDASDRRPTWQERLQRSGRINPTDILYDHLQALLDAKGCQMSQLAIFLRPTVLPSLNEPGRLVKMNTVRGGMVNNGTLGPSSSSSSLLPSLSNAVLLQAWTDHPTQPRQLVRLDHRKDLEELRMPASAVTHPVSCPVVPPVSAPHTSESRASPPPPTHESITPRTMPGLTTTPVRRSEPAAAVFLKELVPPSHGKPELVRQAATKLTKKSNAKSSTKGNSSADAVSNEPVVVPPILPVNHIEPVAHASKKSNVNTSKKNAAPEGKATKAKVKPKSGVDALSKRKQPVKFLPTSQGPVTPKNSSTTSKSPLASAKVPATNSPGTKSASQITGHDAAVKPKSAVKLPTSTTSVGDHASDKAPLPVPRPDQSKNAVAVVTAATPQPDATPQPKKHSGKTATSKSFTGVASSKAKVPVPRPDKNAVADGTVATPLSPSHHTKAPPKPSPHVLAITPRSAIIQKAAAKAANVGASESGGVFDVNNGKKKVAAMADMKKNSSVALPNKVAPKNNSSSKDAHVEVRPGKMAVSDIATGESPPAKKRGRPKGSKNRDAGVDHHATSKPPFSKSIASRIDASSAEMSVFVASKSGSSPAAKTSHKVTPKPPNDDKSRSNPLPLVHKTKAPSSVARNDPSNVEKSSHEKKRGRPVGSVNKSREGDAGKRSKAPPQTNPSKKQRTVSDSGF